MLSLKFLVTGRNKPSESNDLEPEALADFRSTSATTLHRIATNYLEPEALADFCKRSHLIMQPTAETTDKHKFTPI